MRSVFSYGDLHIAPLVRDLQGLLGGVADGSLDVAVAALSITAEHEQICDFSHPYYVTGLGIAIAPRHKTPWLVVLKRLFTLYYLKIVVGLCVLLLALGALIWWFEHKKNPEQFGGGTAAGIGSGFWWSAVTMTTVGYGDKAPITFEGRVVAFIWMLLAIIIVSVLTATITATLAVARTWMCRSRDPRTCPGCASGPLQTQPASPFAIPSDLIHFI